MLVHLVCGDEVKLNVYKHETKDWWDIELVHGCYLTATVRKSDDFVDRSFQNTECTGLAFYHPYEIRYIPQGLKKAFPNLKALWFHGQPMETLCNEELEQFGSSLEYFHFNNGGLVYLTKDPFKFNPNMKSIVIGGNSKLIFVEPEFFVNIKNLQQLKRIQLSENHCISQSKLSPNIDQTWNHTCLPQLPRSCISKTVIQLVEAEATNQLDDDDNYQQ